MDVLLATHNATLTELGNAHGQSQSIYDLNTTETAEYVAQELLELNPDLTLFPMSRGSMHAHRKAGYANKLIVFEFMWAARAGIASAHDQDIEPALPTIMNGAPKVLVDAVRVASRIETGNYERAEKARPAVLGDLALAITNGGISNLDVFDWVTNCDLEDPANRGLLLLLKYDEGLKSKDGSEISILSKAIQSYQQLLPEHFLTDFITACEETPEAFYREARLLSFLKVFARISSTDELQQRLMAMGESWPGDLKAGLEKFAIGLKEIDLATIKKRLEAIQFWGINPSDDELRASWQEALAVLPTSFLGDPAGRHAQIAAKAATKRRRHIGAPDTTPSEDDMGTIKIAETALPVKREIYVLKSTAEGTFVFDNNPQASEEIIQEYVAKFPGVGGLEEQVRAALTYLTTMRIPLGIKKFDNRTLRVAGDDSHTALPLLSFRALPNTGLQGSRIFRRTRIEFIWLPDGNMGLRNIHLRTDQVSGKRKDI